MIHWYPSIIKAHLYICLFGFLDKKLAILLSRLTVIRIVLYQTYIIIYIEKICTEKNWAPLWYSHTFELTSLIFTVCFTMLVLILIYIILYFKWVLDSTSSFQSVMFKDNLWKDLFEKRWLKSQCKQYMCGLLYTSIYTAFFLVVNYLVSLLELCF